MTLEDHASAADLPANLRMGAAPQNKTSARTLAGGMQTQFTFTRAAGAIIGHQ